MGERSRECGSKVLCVNFYFIFLADDPMSIVVCHPHQQVKPPLAPPQMNLKRRRASALNSVAVLLRSKPPVPIDVGGRLRTVCSEP